MAKKPRIPQLVINTRMDFTTMQVYEIPIFCLWDTDDYDIIVRSDSFDYTLCPVGSYNSIVTIH